MASNASLVLTGGIGVAGSLPMAQRAGASQATSAVGTASSTALAPPPPA